MINFLKEAKDDNKLIPNIDFKFLCFIENDKQFYD